jgi:sulfur-oxidizing protein SoxX
VKEEKMMGQAKSMGALSVAALLASTLFMGNVAPAFAAEEETPIQQGKKIVFDNKKGNCLACHKIDDGAMPGDMGPPLMSMKDRFPNKADLRKQIWDPTVRNPETPMPPFGRHKILSEAEIDNVVEYIHSL